MTIAAEILIRAKDAFSDEIRNAKREFASLGDVAKDALAWGGIAATAATAIGAVTQEVAKYGEELHRASEITGLHAEQLSALKYAAEQTGTSFESLTGGMEKF